VLDLNLSGDPFRNLRPLKRTGLVLVLVGLLLAVVDGRTYWRHFTGENQTRVDLQELDAELDGERRELTLLRDQLAAFDSTVINQRAVFVNEQIRQRTFSWSRLFDHLVEILPNDAHLVSLDPQFSDSRRRRQETIREGEVLLEISGVARDSVRLLELIDQAFQHPSFREPDLKNEATRGGVFEFTLSVVYRPDAVSAEETAEPVADAAAEPPTETEAGDETPILAEGEA